MSTATQPRHSYLGYGQLTTRGWTGALVARLMPKADAVWHVGKFTDWHFYSAERVADAEYRPDFAAEQRRSRAAVKAAAAREAKATAKRNAVVREVMAKRIRWISPDQPETWAARLARVGTAPEPDPNARASSGEARALHHLLAADEALCWTPREGCYRHRSASGTHLFYRDGQRHRTDGPAAIYKDGGEDWYIAGRLITQEVKAWLAEGVVRPDWREWSDGDRMAFGLRFVGTD